MSLALLFTNVCKFGTNCGLHFANQYDLIQHIEETHIPAIENDLRKKEEAEKVAAANSGGVGGEEYAKPSQQSQTIPLSVVTKLFPFPPVQKAKPIKPDAPTISFNLNRKRPAPPSQAIPYQPQSANKLSGRFDYDDEASNDSYRPDEGEDSMDASDSDERRYKCPVDGCNKRYKNQQGARYHARMAHSAPPVQGGDDSNTGDTLTVPATPHPPSTNVRPYKCTQCSKRYKTTTGLQNHLQQAHQRVLPLPGQSTPNVIPASPGSGMTTSSMTVTHSPHPSTSNLLTDGTSSQVTIMSKPLPPLASGITGVHSGGPPLGLRVTTQPVQTAPPPVAGGHQYHQQVGQGSSQVRSLASGHPAMTAAIRASPSAPSFSSIQSAPASSPPAPAGNVVHHQKQKRIVTTSTMLNRTPQFQQPATTAALAQYNNAQRVKIGAGNLPGNLTANPTSFTIHHHGGGQQQQQPPQHGHMPPPSQRQN